MAHLYGAPLVSLYYMGITKMYEISNSGSNYNSRYQMQTLKIDMKRSEAALDALIRAVQPLV